MPAPAQAPSRWTTLFVATRLAAAAVAAALLLAHPGTPGLPLALVALGYGSATALAAVRWPPARVRVTVWILDAAIVLGLILLVGEWRSPFYPLALTTLVLPATTLPVRQAGLFGAVFTGGYFAVALATGVDWAVLGATSRLESFSTHLLMPVLIVAALTYAAHLLATLERERSRAEGLAVEAERSRIARELHDSAKQRIHAAHLILSAAEGRSGDGAAGAPVAQAMSELRAATADMEMSLDELRTPLEGRGLSEAVRVRARELGSAGTPIEVTGEPPPELPTFVAVHAFRVASEAMTNAVRHARADRVRVRLGEGRGGLTLEVCDDGAGLPEHPRPGSHGMNSMRARAERLGGELFVGRGEDGGGTLVRLTVPLLGERLAA